MLYCSVKIFFVMYCAIRLCIFAICLYIYIFFTGRDGAGRAGGRAGERWTVTRSLDGKTIAGRYGPMGLRGGWRKAPQKKSTFSGVLFNAKNTLFLAKTCLKPIPSFRSPFFMKIPLVSAPGMLCSPRNKQKRFENTYFRILKRQHLIAFLGGLERVAPAAAAAGNNPCPGTRPLTNRLPRNCYNPFLNPHSDDEEVPRAEGPWGGGGLAQGNVIKSSCVFCFLIVHIAGKYNRNQQTIRNKHEMIGKSG